MPLRAIIEGQEVISSYLSEEEWMKLKLKVKTENLEVIIAETNQPGYLRTSRLGLAHFTHKNGCKPDNWKPESKEHLYIKNEVLLGCRDAGWQARSEYFQNDWIADVFAQKKDLKIAFEVQWSRQSYEKTMIRQKRYDESNVRTCWLFKRPPKELSDWDYNPIPNKNIPIFKLVETEDKNIRVSIGNSLLTVRDFTRQLMQGNFKFCNNVRANKQKVEIRFAKISCYRCGCSQYVYSLNTVRSKCNNRMGVSNAYWENERLKFHPVIQTSIREFLSTDKGSKIKIGKIKSRYSKTVKRSYISFGCYKCDALFGDFPLTQDILYAESVGDVLPYEIEMDLSFYGYENDHWCYSPTKEFCD